MRKGLGRRGLVRKGLVRKGLVKNLPQKCHECFQYANQRRRPGNLVTCGDVMLCMQKK